MKNIYLIGMMGSGKTSCGRELAKLLSLIFVDLDSEIEKRAGKPISDIFKTEGEPHFRKLERDELAQVAGSADHVVATGGGIVLNPTNCEIMRQTGTVIYLRANLNQLWDRVKRNSTRPLLETSDPKESLANLFREREPIYRDIANMVVVTDRKTHQAVARELRDKCLARQA